MAYDPAILDHLESLPTAQWRGIVYRYTASGRSHSKENTYGARWNPRNVPALYTALDRDTALAELEHLLNTQPIPPTKAQFTLYQVETEVEKIVDLSEWTLLERLGINGGSANTDSTACQQLGGAIEWLKLGGALVPSLRREEGINLVIYPMNQDPAFVFEVRQLETIAASTLIHKKSD